MNEGANLCNTCVDCFCKCPAEMKDIRFAEESDAVLECKYYDSIFQNGERKE